MQRVELAEDNLTDAQRKLIQSYNKKQYEIYRQQNRGRTTLFALGLAGIVGSIYFYTMRQMSKDSLVEEMEAEVQSQAELK